MELSGKMEEDFAALKELLPAEDILSFDFAAEGGIAFRILYCDPVTDKELLGTLVVRPLPSPTRSFWARSWCGRSCTTAAEEERKRWANGSHPPRCAPFPT